MSAAAWQGKLPKKDLGSWLIILGYVVVVAGTTNTVREWVAKSASPEVIADLPSQGFIPYLDPAWAMSSEGEQVPSVFDEVHTMAPSVNLPSIAPWEARAPEARDGISASADVLIDGSALESWFPEYLAIPVIGLDVPIVTTDYEETEVQGEIFRQWLAPDSRVAGWQPSSASLGQAGNTVLVGHHNVHGEVFRDLETLGIGDRIWIYSGERAYEYRVSLKMILPEKYESIETRLENARWIQSTQDERITLVTCWPYETNTHRVILVAEPLKEGKGDGWENRFTDQ